MKIRDIFNKSMKEQLRSFWILILTITMAPFFVLVYYLINESSKPSYKLLIINNDQGMIADSASINHGHMMFEMAGQTLIKMANLPVFVNLSENQSKAMDLLKNRKADALIIIPENFSTCIEKSLKERLPVAPEVEFRGDITDYKYILSAIWGNELISLYIEQKTGLSSPFKLKETAIGNAGKYSDFDLYMPGMLILSIIMLMFSASITIVGEVENKTIIRLKLSGLNSFELLTGISAVQIIIGLVSLFLTFAVAFVLGFHPGGSIPLIICITILASVSIIAFSLILAAVTRSANDILIVGNFPLLLFMFFTGAAFPMEGKELFNLAGYSFTIQGIMSPTHAVSAMKKVMIMDLGFTEILPELAWLSLLTILYFAVGIFLFNRRHMKLTG
jgi:ABC-2 type transport system permease protein